MPKKYKIILYIAGIFLILGVGYAILVNLSSSPTNPPTGNGGDNNSQLPDLILPASEEASVREFVKTFVNLYNSYSYGDFSNLTALGDYQTPEMQQQTMDLVDKLQSQTPQGFAVRTTVDSASFSYKYPEATRLLVTVKAQVTETNNNVTSNAYFATVSLELKKLGSRWFVNTFSIQKE